MRTTARLLTGTALAAATVALTAVSATGALAGDFEGLELFPQTAAPGATVTVDTTACGRDGHGRGDARSVGAGDFKLEPGTHKESVVGRFQVAEDAQAGTYGIRVRCDNGREATGDLVVEHAGPSGHVKTGIGGSVAPDTTQIAAGVALLAAAAVGGTLLLRRRASGAQGS
ncbi:hypothetical protein [Streptomyces sp. NPDC051569]|uniref:hypothetical protein n=1 Tax=Streptomyces sp. NPDC051569 TaxID=3365661 RepID=UPI0037993C66